MNKSIVFLLAVSLSLFATAETMDRPSGIKLGQRMVIRPYVGIGYTFDSNLHSLSSDDDVNNSFNINPGFTLTYSGENWSITGSAFYQFSLSTKNQENLNNQSVGENLTFNWSNASEGRGWTAMISESYQYISADDDMSNDQGKGYGRNRQQLNIAGMLSRRINEHWNAGMNASFYLLDYDNDENRYGALYGWKRTVVGLEAAYTASPWSNIFITGNFQHYDQDNSDYVSRSEMDPKHKDWANRYGANSIGFNLHAGISTYATERISYRASAGWSHFNYSDGEHKANGFTYNIAGNWKISDTWTAMLMANSAYQPSERAYGSVTRTDGVSLGLGHSMVRGKLNATLDFAYRHESSEYAEFRSSNRDLNIITLRLGLNYVMNRFLSLYARGEYQTQINENKNSGNNFEGYNRFRLSAGLRLTY